MHYRFALRSKMLMLLFLSLLAPMAVAQQQPASGPEFSSEQFEDWEVRCPTNAQPAICEMTQLVNNPQSGQPIMRVIMAYPQEIDTAAMIFLLPLGVRLSPGLQLVVDNGEPINFPYQVCQQQGCRADLPISESLRQRMRNGSTATVSVIGPRGNRLDLPVSLQGFTAADDSISG
ncbi:Invasion protein IalB, involved in pathogenesis [Modicisalibacter muralis]|uniref:Invasion protein IalB, involved in pathogenesis n=1 Tax=Modicisalibacter muralis TaxID=119000 RepID=A0A1G9PVK5_9GAMM|nr:invasion associated locus B family protein [Halomonas muralis]SDM02822.1 Invasion protein IalB, involved in pathogenesis [Halomonas muralis]